MPDDLEQLESEAATAIDGTASLADLQAVEVRYLGSKGAITSLMRGIGALPPAERPAFGQRVNRAKAALMERITARREALEGSESARRLAAERVDVTLP